MTCALCGSPADLTDEDVVPKWMLRAFDVRGRATVSVREEASNPSQVALLKRYKVTLDEGLCRRCNNVLLGKLEQAVKPVLEPMAIRREPTILNLADQSLLALWAIKTVYLLELAIRRRHPGQRRAEGYLPSSVETGWLRAQLEQWSAAKSPEPPPYSKVWLAGWDCREPGGGGRASMLNYAPSAAPLPTPSGGNVMGQFTTLAVGFAAFQVFTVNFLEAERLMAEGWNPDPPAHLAQSVSLIWPRRLYAADLAWPSPIFANDAFDRLATWDMALRP